MTTASDIIKRWEGLRLTAYPDPGTGGKPWTIGYGHTRNVKQGDTCTLDQALAWLAEDMDDAYKVIDNAVTVPLTRQQRDALCSFVFNVGVDAFQKSTLLRMLNEGNYTGAAAQLDRWNKAGGRVMQGLVNRRKQEKALFLSGTNLSVEVFTEEKPVAPFLVAAIPALINALPEFAKIFQKPDVAERNVEAAVKASEIIMQATGSANVQEAVEKVQADPEIAATANEALRLNRADLMDTLERLVKIDEQSVKDARAFSTKDKPVIGNWHFVHILSLLLILMGGAVAVGVVFTSEDVAERTMALQTLMLIGFASVVSFWLGSSRSSQIKDLTRD